jgi:hypothetical protein
MHAGIFSCTFCSHFRALNAVRLKNENFKKNYYCFRHRVAIPWPDANPIIHAFRFSMLVLAVSMAYTTQRDACSKKIVVFPKELGAKSSVDVADLWILHLFFASGKSIFCIGVISNQFRVLLALFLETSLLFLSCA